MTSRKGDSQKSRKPCPPSPHKRAHVSKHPRLTVSNLETCQSVQRSFRCRCPCCSVAAEMSIVRRRSPYGVAHGMRVVPLLLEVVPVPLKPKSCGGASVFRPRTPWRKAASLSSARPPRAETHLQSTGPRARFRASPLRAPPPATGLAVTMPSPDKEAPVRHAHLIPPLPSCLFSSCRFASGIEFAGCSSALCGWM
jgi:hypothetical protein